MLGSVQKSVYIRHFLVCTNVINNGVMVMYRPPAYYSGKVPDEKLIFNKEWPNRSTFDAATEKCSSSYQKNFKTWALFLQLSNSKRYTRAQTRQKSTVYATNTIQTWNDLCEPGFWGVKIGREYTHARKIFTISPKQKIQAALSAVKDGEDIRKVERCIVFNFTLFGII